jgi:putative ABC transport system permease protein
MSAVWRVARAAVRRRRLQTFVIGVVVLLSTATLVVALGLLDAAAGPFDQAFNRQNGAQITAAFAPAKISDHQLAQTARRPGVEAASGPFGQAVVEVPATAGILSAGRRLTVVGRAGPAGPVDRLNLWAGHWATGPGEIVLEAPPLAGNSSVGAKITLPSGPTLTVVGMASSTTRTAGAWVAPSQIQALHPTGTQMLYRFTSAATTAEIRSDLASVTGGLPRGALLNSTSYLTVKDQVDSGPGTFVPFLMVFGVLGLIVAVVIIINVISGAVVTGFRHIGVLKAMGFTPPQVVAVYLLMVCAPAILGCVVGTALGNVLAMPLLKKAFESFISAGVILPASVSPLVDVACLLGVPALVGLSAIVPALRANRMPAVEALSAGSRQHAGRAMRIQRWLAVTRLPRSVSLGLGLPFARPARSALTMVTVVLGVTVVTFAIGLTGTLNKFQNADPSHNSAGVQAVLQAGGPQGEREPRTAATTKLGDEGTQVLLRSLAGAVNVTAEADVPLNIAGSTQTIGTTFYRGSTGNLGFRVVKGRWYHGPGEIVLSSKQVYQSGLAVGDGLTLDLGGRQTHVTIVGEVMTGPGDSFADWTTLQRLSPHATAQSYNVQLAHGTDVNTYLAKAQAADPGLSKGQPPTTSTTNVIVTSFASLITLMLGTVSALGVLNTVVLNTRERRRDLGMLKSIGMTPRQVTAMVVTSMAALGLLGGVLGVPLGVAAHRLIMPLSSRAAETDLPSSMLDVWNAPMLALLALAGVAIAALGTLLPARSAARLTIAEVLHSE